MRVWGKPFSCCRMYFGMVETDYERINVKSFHSLSWIPLQCLVLPVPCPPSAGLLMWGTALERLYRDKYLNMCEGWKWDDSQPVSCDRSHGIKQGTCSVTQCDSSSHTGTHTHTQTCQQSPVKLITTSTPWYWYSRVCTDSDRASHQLCLPLPSLYLAEPLSLMNSGRMAFDISHQ